MLGEQYPYYQLLQQIDLCSDDELHSTVESWVVGNLGEGAWLRGLAEADAEVIPQVSKEDLCRLYAISRVSDALIVRGFKNSVALASYPAFMNGLGLDAFTVTSFHPFYHEIVYVESDLDSETPLSIWEVNWPGFMCGPLMIEACLCFSQLPRGISGHQACMTNGAT